MKRHHIHICLLLLLGTFTACQQDDDNNNAEGNGPALVTLRIGTADMANTTRAWNDDNALVSRAEMMYNWTVLVVNSSNQIAYKYTNDDADGVVAADNAEIDVVCQNVSMASGTYTVYSFANISEASLQTILGVSSLEPGTALSDVDQKTVTINANLKQEADITADNAFGLGSKGIPMSNRQTLTVNGTVEKDLIVVRMVAKLEFIFFNCTGENEVSGEDLTVKSVSISGITSASTGNLKLLPNLNNVGTTTDDEMTFTHGDIRPNLATGITTEEVKFVPANALSVASTDTYDISKLPGNANYASAKKFVFYVNESQLATSDDRFELNVELANGDYRYTLVSTGTGAGLEVGKTGGGGNEDPTTTPVTATPRSEDWTYIARNDYRVIPIVLDNYRLELVPYDFPAIGVYPVSVKTIDATTNLHEILFHDYGHFHLVPHVYRGTAWAGTESNAAYPWTGKDIAFSATAPSATPFPSPSVWTLQNAGVSDASPSDWTNAFRSFTTTGTGASLAKDAELTFELNRDATQFYGAPDATGAATYPAALPVYGKNFDGEVTHTASGKTYSQGDFPMLDTETEWNSMTPYIFGQIAPQVDEADKTVYHELRVNVYVQGETVARQLIYRYYMHLQQDFGLSRRCAPRPTCSLHRH